MSSVQKISTLTGAILYMMILGTIYIVGSINPYLASYFKVAPSETQTILPSIILVQTLVVLLGGKLTSTLSPRACMAIGGSIYATTLLACATFSPL
jgi:hypothetical protein